MATNDSKELNQESSQSKPTESLEAQVADLRYQVQQLLQAIKLGGLQPPGRSSDDPLTVPIPGEPVDKIQQSGMGPEHHDGENHFSFSPSWYRSGRRSSHEGDTF